MSGFDPLTGLIDYRQSGPGGNPTLHNLAYDWDLNGNLRERQDLRQGLTEVFTYDGLNRLDVVTLNGGQTVNLDYDLIGNITRKTDVSPDAWTYHASKKHAVTATGSGGPTYSYDANGNVATRNGATLSWTSFNLPSVINGSGVSSQFWYGPDRQRFKQVASYSGGTETTHYVGGVLEKLVTGSNTHYKHFIAGPTGLIAIYTRRVSGNPLEDTFYFTHDHQGNVDSITQADSSVQVRLSYDAFGKRRNEAGWSGPVPGADWTAIANSSRRGYTEHEHLDNLGLIHMNGRVQDPLIGRFLSADPFVEDPFDGQSFNRYSYVRNNPLTYVDPTGFCRDPNGCDTVQFGFGSRFTFAPNLYGTGALTYTASVLAAYMEITGQGLDSITAEPNVDQFNRQLEQLNQAVSASVDEPTQARKIWDKVVDRAARARAYVNDLAENAVEYYIEQDEWWSPVAGAAAMTMTREHDLKTVAGLATAGAGAAALAAGRAGMAGAEVAAGVGTGVGSPTAGKPVDSRTRDKILTRDQKPDGSWECATCGQSTKNPSNIHTGHVVPRSKGGDLSEGNLRCQGAACNLSQGNRDAPNPGMTCKERGSCGAPYGRSD